MPILRLAPVAAFLALALNGCHQELPLCGDPSFGFQLTYEVVDAATGQDWFTGMGHTSGDSLHVLPFSNGFSLGPAAKRYGAIYRLGPTVVFDQGQGTATQLLRFNAQDVDTVLIHFRYGPVQKGPCGEYKAVEEVEITYNGRPNGLFRASVPTDSLQDYGILKVILLRKRP